MRMLFDERGVLVSTDYFRSDQYRARVPCCAVREGVWHLLMPDRSPVLPEQRNAYVIPLLAKDQPEGWAWRLCIRPAWTLRLPVSCFVYPAPALPEKGDEHRALLVIYGYWLPGLSPRKHEDLGVEGEPLETLFSAPLRVVRASEEERIRLGGTPRVTYH